MKRKKMTFRTAMAIMLSLALLLSASPASASTIYTPYMNISASPGDTIRYSVDLINDSNSIQNADLSLNTNGHDWTYEMTAGGHDIRQISVLPDASQTVNLALTVPHEVNIGEYTFSLHAGVFGSLSLKVNVLEQGAYKSELSVDQPNMQGHADTKFTYSLRLNNRTADKQQYALTAEIPTGWDARFTADGNSVTSVEIEAGASKTVTLNLTPAENAPADTYRVNVYAASGSSSTSAEVEAVITGSYGMTLTTVDDRLSANVTAGKERKLELIVRNTGSADLTDISLTGTTPANWEVSFEPKTIQSLKAGESKPVTATIKSSDQSLAGDYLVGLTASAAEKSANASIRMTVKTSVLWGWIGVLIVLAVVAGVYGLFRKYGRR